MKPINKLRNQWCNLAQKKIWNIIKIDKDKLYTLVVITFNILLVDRWEQIRFFL
jgi:hypothetical protein